MRRLLATLCPDAKPVAGTAEEIPQPDGSVDAVFAAEAFHRFDGRRALAEIARILRPHGVLVLMWNLPVTGWAPAVAPAERLLGDRLPRGELLYDPFDLGSVIFTSGEWRAAFAGSPFEPLRERRFPNPQTLDRGGLVSFFASMGWIADLPDGERLPLLDEVRSCLAAPSYRRTWETHVFWTRRLPADDVA